MKYLKWQYKIQNIEGAKKLNEIQEKDEIQHKEARKTIQFKKWHRCNKKEPNRTSGIEKFQNTVGSLRNRLDKQKKEFQSSKTYPSNPPRQKTKEFKKTGGKKSLREIKDYVMQPNLWLTGILEKDESSNLENTFEKIIQENFPNLSTEVNKQIQKNPEKSCKTLYKTIICKTHSNQTIQKWKNLKGS